MLGTFCLPRVRNVTERIKKSVDKIATLDTDFDEIAWLKKNLLMISENKIVSTIQRFLRLGFIAKLVLKVRSKRRLNSGMRARSREKGSKHEKKKIKAGYRQGFLV